MANSMIMRPFSLSFFLPFSASFSLLMAILLSLFVETALADVSTGAQTGTVSYHNAATPTPDNKAKNIQQDSQGELNNRTAIKQRIITDEYHRETPRSAIEHYLNAARKGDYSRAIHYIDFKSVDKNIRKIPKEEVARLFKLVLDRALWVDLPTLSDHPSGYTDDEIAGDRDLVGYVPLAKGKVPIYVQRITAGNGEVIWQLAGITINQLPMMYRFYGDGPVGEFLTQYVPKKVILGLQLWQWIALILAIIISGFIAWLPTRLLADKIKRGDSFMAEQVAAIISGPVRALIIVLLLRWSCGLLSFSLEFRQISQGYTLLIIAFTWAILSVINIMRDYYVHRFTEGNRKAIAKLLHPLTTMIKIIIVVTAILVWLENLGFKATTILAGLGVGGLAFALAAQKSIENLIAAITLYVTRPVKIGNLCKVDKYLGFVEDIGLRYTKIRTLDRTLVSISNATFADLKMENYSERNRIRFKPELVFSHQTSQESIKAVMADIKQLLDDHEKICEKPCRVRLASYLEHGISVSVMSYVDTTLFAVYAEVSNELNLEILEILNKHDVKLADVSRRGVTGGGEGGGDEM